MVTPEGHRNYIVGDKHQQSRAGDRPVSFLTGELSWTSVILFILAMLVFGIVSLYLGQNNLLYKPVVHPSWVKPSQNPKGYRSPSDFRMPYDNIYLTTEDNVRLHAWFIKQRNPRNSPTILFFHANAGNMGFRLPNLEFMYRKLHANIFVVSYRGYGESEGTPTEAGLLIDGETAWRWVYANIDQVNRDEIFVFGRSLGGAVALSVSARHPGLIRATMLENTFTCISDMVDHLLPFITPIKRWALKIDWNSMERMKTVTHPVLLLSGRQDQVVPCDHMDKLYDAAVQSPRRVIVRFPAGDHNDTWQQPGYEDAIVKFFSGYVTDKPTADTLPPEELQGQGGLVCNDDEADTQDPSQEDEKGGDASVE